MSDAQHPVHENATRPISAILVQLLPTRRQEKEKTGTVPSDAHSLDKKSQRGSYAPTS